MRWSEEASFGVTNDTATLLRVLEALWRRYPQDSFLEPQAVGVVLAHLEDAAGVTLSMFDEDRHLLNEVLDAVNLRYGKNALYFGGAHHAIEKGPPRIAFNHIPNQALG
jgi:DNA polymerase-4